MVQATHPQDASTDASGRDNEADGDFICAHDGEIVTIFGQSWYGTCVKCREVVRIDWGAD